MRIRLFFLAAACALVASCNQKTEKAPKAFIHSPTGEVKTSRVVISQDEYLTIIDVPDNYVGKRCWVYVNDKIKTSHMKCDDELTKTE